MRCGADARSGMDAIDLARADERGRAPGVDPLPLHRLRDFVAPERAQMLQPPVGYIGIKAHDHFDPLGVRVIEAGAGRSGVDGENARLRCLDGTEIGHGARIPDRGGNALRDHNRALLAEVCGTFWFFFIGAGSILTVASGRGGGLLDVALAHGIALAIAISAFGALSGGHFNPAVTFGLAVAGKHPGARVPTYWAAQLIGGVLAGFALRYVFDFAIAAIDKTHLGTPSLGNGITPLSGIFVEAVLTLFLVWAVYGTAVSPLAPRIAGFGIGLTVMTDILLGGPLTGAAMNPARWFGTAGPARFFRHWYVYWSGPPPGAPGAGL